MSRPIQPTRPTTARRPVGAPLLRGAITGSAGRGTDHRADLAATLTQLAAMARQGLLTPQEFTAAKARLLGD